MFNLQAIDHWVHEVAKPTKSPGRTEKMLLRIHLLTEDEEEQILATTKSMFLAGPRRRTKRDWSEQYPLFHAKWRGFYAGQFLRQRLSTARARHPVCTNKANGLGEDGLPLTRKASVWHIGNLKKLRPKRTGRSGSHEGPGMSVSECPEAWRSIAGINGPLWRLSRTDGELGRFVDFHALTKAQLDDYVATAVRRRLIRRSKGWRIELIDEEGHGRWVVFANRHDAEHQLGDCDDGMIEEVVAYEATAKLDTWWRQYFTRSLAKCSPRAAHEELATLKLMMDEGRYDGVWWYDKYDPDGLSAPRGVIFPTRLAEWERCCEDQASATEP